jgi:class 3 adenylate cyclase
MRRESTTPEMAERLDEVHFDNQSLLSEIMTPTLVIHRRGDQTCLFVWGQYMARRLPNCRFLPLDGDAHFPWVDAGDSVLGPTIEFLTEADEPPDDASEPPEAGAFRTILFTDVEGSTALTQRLGDAKAREVLRTHERIVREALKAHGGAEVKTMGDGFMASFSSATGALECAIALQRAFAEHNESAQEPIRVRVGLNAGEPIAEEDDLFGTAVIAAARIAAQAAAGEILTSNVVRELVAGKDFLFADRGEAALRGFDDPVRLFEVRWRET